MPNCVICNKALSHGAFSLKDKYELTGHTFICKECAGKIGITNLFGAGMYTAEKAKKKYFEMYPDSGLVPIEKQHVSNEVVAQYLMAGDKQGAVDYIMNTGQLGYIDAEAHVIRVQRAIDDYNKKLVQEKDDAFIEKIKSIRAVDYSDSYKGEAKYLRRIMHNNEQLIYVVTGRIKRQHDPEEHPGWLMALTDKRIVLLQKGLASYNCFNIPLEEVSRVLSGSGLLTAAISIYYSGTWVQMLGVKKNCDTIFAELAIQAKQLVKDAPSQSIVQAVHDLGTSINSQSNISVADELKKFKELLDMGVISQEEFDAQKAKLLGK